MILFDRVTFSYNDRRVLNELSFHIGQAERVAILGGSGGGKTTILKLILGLIRPDSGRITVDGEDISLKTEAQLSKVRTKFSLVFQEGALFDSMNVKENVAFSLREYTKMTETDIDRRVTELLSVVGLDASTAALMPDELSGGMHRRVAIARSLAASDPLMFLYDEPTAGLDPISADTICNLIPELARGGKGIVVVTHKIYDAMKVAERFLFLKEGSIIFDGDQAALAETSLSYVRMFMSELRGPVC